MRIFAGGIATETNSFSPLPTGLDDFAVERAGDVETQSTFDLAGTWQKQAHEAGHDYIFSLMAWAQPAGVTTKHAYETLRNELLEALSRALPVDVVLLNLHGAMIADGYLDEGCELDIARRVRQIAGQTAIIGVELDLHCNIHPDLLDQADIIVTYKEYPHFDINDRAREVFALSIAAREGRIRPTMALHDCRMLGLYPTSREPMRSFVDDMKATEQHNGVLSISFAHGFHYGDLAHTGAKMLVVTDDDKDAAAELARQFAERIHAHRHEIGFEAFARSLDEALFDAAAAQDTPVVVADQSDNVGTGAPGDSTYALRWLIDRDIDAAIAILYDPEAVRIATKAGVGAALTLRLGGKLSAASGQPLDVDAQVLSLRGNYQHAFPQASGSHVYFPAGDLAAFQIGRVSVVASSIRCQCFCPEVFDDMNIDLRAKRIVVVKSMQHFHDSFKPIASRITYMAGPGAVPPDPRLLTYHKLDARRLYPFADTPLP